MTNAGQPDGRIVHDTRQRFKSPLEGFAGSLVLKSDGDCIVTTLHPAAPPHLPIFITAPGQTDVLFVVTTSIIVGMILLVGVIFFWLHSLPERVAHKSKKIQFEIVGILALLSLFTNQHIFWVVGLLLAFVELPNFSHPLRSMALSLEKLAGKPKSDLPQPDSPSAPPQPVPFVGSGEEEAPRRRSSPATRK